MSNTIRKTVGPAIKSHDEIHAEMMDIINRMVADCQDAVRFIDAHPMHIKYLREELMKRVEKGVKMKLMSILI